MPNTWSLFPMISAPMPFQMALDETLFRQRIDGIIQKPVLRFYFSSEPWITVGYSHPESTNGRVGEWANEQQKEASPSRPFAVSPIPVCKRITGGGQVLHGKDLIFSLIARKEDEESFGSVRVSYWKIHEAVKAGFEKIGKQPRFYRCDEKLPRGGECFLYPIATDLALENRKVAGGAQKRSMGVLLHQESIQKPEADLFELAEKIKASFEEIFQMKLENMICEPEVLERAKQLAKEKYERTRIFS